MGHFWCGCDRFIHSAVASPTVLRILTFVWTRLAGGGGAAAAEGGDVGKVEAVADMNGQPLVGDPTEEEEVEMETETTDH